MGEGRKYTRQVTVPGIHTDPTRMNDDTLWYKRTVTLPIGSWKHATLELKGARFAPAVFVDGVLVSRSGGGMAPTFHLLQGKTVKPGKTVTIEVALTSLRELPKTDASYIAISDHWRSNISSSLWDDVLLHVHGDVRVENVVPAADTEKKQLDVSVFIDEVGSKKKHSGGQAVFVITDSNGRMLYSHEDAWKVGRNTIHAISEQVVAKNTPAFGHIINNIKLTMPEKTGSYTLKAELLNGPSWVSHPIVSAWDVRVFQASVPDRVASAHLFVPDYEMELREMLMARGLTICQNAEKADAVVLSAGSWKRLSSKDTTVNRLIEQAIGRGTSVVMLDVGPQSYGKGYPVEGQSLKSLLNPPSVSKPRLQDYKLFGSIIFHFKETAEAETNLFPDVKNNSLWQRLPTDYRGMWNGLRGDLVVPAWEMEVQGVNADLFMEQWTARGADESAIRSGQPYYAYELHGYYDFSTKANDSDAQQRLKTSVMQKIEDAPSLAIFINPNIPIKQTDLAAGYRNANVGMAQSMMRMANAGKNLTKVPVICIQFGNGKGNLLVSQLLTSGRLANSGKTGKPFERRYDETAVQMVLNMIEQTLK